MRQIRVKETRNRRYLGAVRFVDNATSGVVRRQLHIDAEGLRFILNQSQLHVIFSAEGLENHLSSFFAPPDQPAVESQSYNLTIFDPLREYLPRIKTIKLPRNADPTIDDSLFEPINVSMFASASCRLRSNWSIIRASVFDVEDLDHEVPIPGALLRIKRDEDNKLVGSGLTDQRGEALVIIPGIPITNFVSVEEQPEDGVLDHEDWLASGDVVEKETPVKLSVVVDKELPWPVDPELLEEKSNAWRRKIKIKKNGALKNNVNLKLKTGQTQTIKLFVKVSNGS